MRARWDEGNQRWIASLGSGKKRVWFRCKTKGEDGRLLVESRIKEFLDGPDVCRPGCLSSFIEETYWPVIKGRVSENTRRTYRGIIDNDFDDIQPLLLIDLRLPALQTWVNSQVAKGLTPKTISAKWGVLRSILEMAARMGKYPHRDHELVTLPRQARQSRIALTYSQVAALLDVSKGRTVEGPFWAATHLGLRLNECLGLTPSDVEIMKDRAVIVVRRGRHAFGVSDRLKSKATGEVRRFVVPKQWGEKLLSYSKPETLFVFTNRKGHPVQPARMAKEIGALCEKAEVPIVTFHDLRHSCATNLRHVGVPESMIRDVLGHSDARMTQNYLETRDDEMLEAFSRLGSKG